MRKCAFLDRDGVINHDDGYIHKPEDFRWIDDAPKAIKYLQDLGYLLIIVTNQGGIAKGLYSEKDLHLFHEHLQNEAAEFGIKFDDIYYCPHHIDGVVEEYSIKCDCRKPEAGMLEAAITKWNIDCSKSFIIGDRISDIEAAAKVGVAGHQFFGGNLYDFIIGFL